LSPSNLILFLSPGRTIALRRSGLIKPRVTAKAVYGPPPGGGSQSWEGAVRACGDAMKDLAGGKVRVILSNHFAQFAIQPWNEDLKDGEEEAAMARHHFQEIYGSQAGNWNVQVDMALPGEDRLSVAVPNELLQALRAEIDKAGGELVSVKPYFVAAYNTWRRHFDASRPGWLVTHEEGRLCLGLQQKGRWRWIRTLRVGNDWRERLPDIVDNEALLAGVAEQTAEVLVFAPAEPMLVIRSGTRLPYMGLRLEACPGFSPQTDSVYGLAMIG
jgi:hypothetical protein